MSKDKTNTGQVPSLLETYDDKLRHIRDLIQRIVPNDDDRQSADARWAALARLGELLAARRKSDEEQ